MKLFVHIPKNGGSSVRGLVRPDILCAPVGVRKCIKDQAVVAAGPQRTNYGVHHARWCDFNHSVRQHQAFAIVRNPWARVVSQYEYLKRILNELKNVPHGELIPCKSFDHFLDTRFIYGRQRGFWLRPTMSWFQQKDYVVDRSGQIRCDVLRLESNDVCRYLGIEKLPKHNTGNIEDYRTYYTAATYDIIAGWYADDIETFGFTFDGAATTNIWNP